MRQLLTALLLLSGGVAGCTVGPPEVKNVYEGLQSDNPALRVRSAVVAGERRDDDAVPLLIDRLSDISSNVRLFSGMALRKITNEDFGWRAYASQAERNKAVDRWREWLRQRRRLNREKTALPEPVS